jgi:AbrB family looped-hinge helix DNA binding protein
MAIGTLSEKGWVVIPKEIREKFGLKKGAKLLIFSYGDRITIAPLSEDPIGSARGMFKDGPSLTENYMREKKLDEDQRDAKHARLHPTTNE